MSAKAINIHDVPETLAVFNRTLPDGSRLEYRMQVLQQPERARACGMGAKSHADRRPVDPPPVVELRLFSGTEKTDVTFSHNSNFFLFATLEQARPIAQGRGMPAPAPAPVLTGVPVSGMAYLDRPNPAGYFIFPDLSVRHEGKYRLRFALYEETKEDLYPLPQDPLEPREFCTHRLDVKSRAFTVFSAKKFPGLAESTALSRIVAEQGCRVRIRRDVRMRRRTDRQGRESEEQMDETAILRAQRAGGGGGATPDQYEIENSIRAQNHQQQQQQQQPQYQQPAAHQMHRSNSADRKRSGSDTSVMSISDIPPQPPRFNGYAAPSPGHNSYGSSNGPQPAPTAHHHLTFSNGLSQTHAPPPAPPQQAHPSQLYVQQQQQQQQQMQPRYPPQAHAVAAPHHPSPHMAVTSRPASNQYASVAQYHVQQNPMSLPSQQIQQNQVNGHHIRRNSEELRLRRESDAFRAHQSTQYRPNTPSIPPQYAGQMDNGYIQHQSQYQPPSHQVQYHHQPTQQASHPPPPTASNNSLPPLRLPALEPKLWNSQPTTPNSTAPTAPLPSPSTYQSANGTMQQRLQPAPQVPAPAPASHFPSYYPQDKYDSPSREGWNVSNSSSVSSQGQSDDSRGSTTLGKREWGRVFNPSHVEGPMRDHMRPSSSSTSAYGNEAWPQPAEQDDDAYDLGKLKMAYRRADGVEIVRRMPGES